MNDIAVAVVETLRDFDELTNDWARLYDRSQPRNPFLSPDWTKACWGTINRRAELFVVTVRRAGVLVGLAPLCIEPRAGFRTLRFIAEGRSDYLGFLRGPDDQDVDAILMQAILQCAERWDLASFRQIVAEPFGLEGAPLSHSFKMHSVPVGSAPYTAADVDWETLHAIGPPWLKRTRKRLPRFLRDGWQFERLTGANAAARLDQVAEIEARSWKARRDAMRLQPGLGQELIRRAFETLGSRGEMQLWIASIDGRAAAYEIDFTLPDRLWIYQLGYDLGFQRASVGSFLSYIAIEHAWAAGAREYDYMLGDEAYKIDRTTASRQIRHVAIHARNARGRAAFLMLLAPRWRLREVPVFRGLYRIGRKVRG